MKISDRTASNIARIGLVVAASLAVWLSTGKDDYVPTSAKKGPEVKTDLKHRIISPTQGVDGATESVQATFVMEVTPVEAGIRPPDAESVQVYAQLDDKPIEVKSVTVNAVPTGEIPSGTTATVTITCTLTNADIPKSGNIAFVLGKLNWGNSRVTEQSGEFSTSPARFVKAPLYDYGS